jgi:PKD repeat protein
LSGTISADGLDGSESYGGSGGGSGGSIWVQTGVIAGDGIVRADGGNGGVSNWYPDGGGGSGGRVAIYADTDQFDGTVQAFGGSGQEYGEAGTIHLSGLFIVGFTADPVSGYAPLTVTFTNTTTGVATGYEWDFGDGATSAITHPTHVYTAPGVYTVILTATGSGGSDTLVRAGYVAVAPPIGELYLEVGVVGGVDSSSYTTVTLARSYDSMVVIATGVYSDNTRPLVTRVRHAQGNSFQASYRTPETATPWNRRWSTTW